MASGLPGVFSHVETPLRSVIAGMKDLRELAPVDDDVATDIAALETAVWKILARFDLTPIPALSALEPGLSKREVQVLRHVASGMSNKEIARLLAISRRTVRNHLSNVFRKLNASNRTQAVINAMRTGLLLL
jgi:DNA-binding CsgD family transcriptional regulator